MLTVRGFISSKAASLLIVIAVLLSLALIVFPAFRSQSGVADTWTKSFVGFWDDNVVRPLVGKPPAEFYLILATRDAVGAAFAQCLATSDAHCACPFAVAGLSEDRLLSFSKLNEATTTLLARERRYDTDFFFFKHEDTPAMIGGVGILKGTPCLLSSNGIFYLPRPLDFALLGRTENGDLYLELADGSQQRIAPYFFTFVSPRSAEGATLYDALAVFSLTTLRVGFARQELGTDQRRTCFVSFGSLEQQARILSVPACSPPLLS